MRTIDALRSGHLKGAKRLDLADDLTQFPLEILELAESLEILNFANNHLKTLPDEFRCLQNLKIAFFSNNDFEELPAVLSQCPQLSMVSFKSNKVTAIADDALPSSIRWLILTDNQIEQLPTSWGQLHRLQKLMLAGNQLRSLPDEMAACQSLELIRLSANQLTTLPSWLFQLPRLSWLAYSGNPIGHATASPPPSLVEIDWAKLTILDRLGEGASGLIFKGIWMVESTQGVDVAIDVAIKVFKGTVTSDGLPIDEMQAWIAADSHPHLIRLLGKVSGHPEQKAGLVFAFVPPSYKPLGYPPSLDTCTRDTYPADVTFAVSVILQITQGIAAAVAHLHSKGISHGDLYAHNILVNAEGDSLLGDFGAASFYPSSPPSLARSLECLEVRAFGCLLEDLLDRCIIDAHPPQRERLDRLRSLQQQCMSPEPLMRPSFNQIDDALGQLL